MDSNTKNSISSFEFKDILLTLKIFVKIVVLTVVYIGKSVINILKIVKEKDINGQVALITGGANGLGKEITSVLASKGCNVAIVDIDENSGKILAQNLIKEYKIKAEAYNVDVCNISQVEELKIKIENDLGYVNILINNAGLLSFKPTLNKNYSLENIEKLLSVNIFGNFVLIKTFIKGMKERKSGHIVAISSLAAIVQPPISLDYTCSKEAIKSLMDSLYNDLGITGHDQFIYTTTAYPGFIYTNDNVIRMLNDSNLNKILRPIEVTKAGKLIVKGILMNKRKVYIPKWTSLLQMKAILPAEVYKKILKFIIEIYECDKFVKDMK